MSLIVWIEVVGSLYYELIYDRGWFPIKRCAMQMKMSNR